MDISRFALGSGVDKSSATHHDNHSFRYYSVAADRIPDLLDMYVRSNISGRPLCLSERAGPSCRLFMDLDSNKDPNGPEFSPEDFQMYMTLVQRFVNRELDKRKEEVLITSEKQELAPAAVMGKWERKEPFSWCVQPADLRMAISLASKVKDNRFTYHVIWPFVFVPRRVQAEIWKKFLEVEISFRNAAKLDSEVNFRGTLRAVFNGKDPDHPRSFFLDRVFHGDGTLMSFTEWESLLSWSVSSVDGMFCLVRAVTLLFHPRPETVAPLPVRRPREEHAEFSYDLTEARKKFQSNDARRWVPSRLKDAMEGAVEGLGGDFTFEDVQVALEAAVVPLINEFFAQITCQSKHMAVFKVPDPNSKFPIYVIKKLKDVQLLLEPGGRVTVPINKKSKTFSAFQIWSQSINVLTFSRIVFESPETIQPDELNNFRGLEIGPNDCWGKHTFHVTGRRTGQDFSVQTVLDHFFSFFANHNVEVYRYMINWLAWRIQNPALLHDSAIIILSHEGVGKDVFFAQMMRAIIGKTHFLQTACETDMVGKFNAAMESKIMVVWDEADGLDEGKMTALKNLITNDQQRVERKGIDAFYQKSAAGVCIFANTPSDNIMPVSAQARRWVISRADSSIVGNLDYFSDMINDFLGVGKTKEDQHLNGVMAFADFLYRVDVSHWDPRKIPITDALINNKLSSAPYPHLYLQECLQSGQVINMFKEWSSTHPGLEDKSDLWKAYTDWTRNRGITRPGVMANFLDLIQKIIRQKDPSSPSIELPVLKSAREMFSREYTGVTFPNSEGLPTVSEPRWEGAPSMVSESSQTMDV